jgi:hypothetical protein
MQLQLLRKKDLGFALNQVKQTLNQFLQTEQHELATLLKIIELYFNDTFDLSTFVLDTYIIPENVVLSVLNKLAVDCKVYVSEIESKGWLWNKNNIDRNIELNQLFGYKFYDQRCFADGELDFLERNLFEEHTYQLNKDTPLKTVLKHLRI